MNHMGSNNRCIDVLKAANTEAVLALAFAPGGQCLAAASDDGTVAIWDCTAGRIVQHLDDHACMALSVAFSPDGRSLAAPGRACAVRLWDWASGRHIRDLRDTPFPTVNALAWDRSSGVLASGDEEGDVTLWKMNGDEPAQIGRLEHDRPAEVHSLAFTPDGRMLAAADDYGDIALWDWAAGEELWTLEGHNDHLHSVAFSPDGRFLAAPGPGNTVRLWDWAHNRITAELAHGRDATPVAVAFSPVNRTLASGDDKGRVIVWQGGGRNYSRGRRLTLCHDAFECIQSVAFSPDGSVLASSDDLGTIALWRMN